jgi:hypothetical protein
MAIIHTALMGLQKLSTEGFYEEKITSGLIRLDEGHDRPVWEHLSREARLIPYSPETIMLDGILLLAMTELGLNSVEGINTASKESVEECFNYIDTYDLKKSAHKASKSPAPFIDLSDEDVSNNLYDKLASLLQGHQVNIILLSGNGENLSRDLSRLGIKYEVYEKIG